MKYKFSIIGSGYLSQIIIQAYKDNKLPDFELVGVLQRKGSKHKLDSDVKVFSTIDELLETKPDFTVEAASKESLIEYGEMILNAKSHIVTLSIGALADNSVKDKLTKTALKNERKIYIPSGAVGGFDVLKTMSYMSPITATIHSKKNPDDLRDVPEFSEKIKEVSEITPLLNVSTREAYNMMPRKLNVGIATALASAGVEDTILDMAAYPNFKGDQYLIEAVGEEVKVKIDIYSRTSAIAAWSVVHTLNNAVSPLVFS